VIGRDAQIQPGLEPRQDDRMDLIPISNEIWTFPRVGPDLAGRWQSHFLSARPEVGPYRRCRAKVKITPAAGIKNSVEPLIFTDDHRCRRKQSWATEPFTRRVKGKFNPIDPDLFDQWL